jgi:hypothetical protein
MAMGDNGIKDYKKFRRIDNDFDCHATGAIQLDAHCLMERICGFV